MEPEGSLPCSQQPATGPYFEADESIPRPQNLFPGTRFNSNIPSEAMRNISEHIFLYSFTSLQKI
jgi:hypothetical protein